MATKNAPVSSQEGAADCEVGRYKILSPLALDLIRLSHLSPTEFIKTRKMLEPGRWLGG